MLRRDLLAGAGAALTSAIFTGRIRGANDRIAIGFIGAGAMGSSNLGYALDIPEFQVAAVCDVYLPHLERARDAAAKKDVQVRAIHDFREMIADKSIDTLCISTPDHWHAYMTIEACKAGKDVYVEKPACTYVEEGQLMVKAARKYNRVVQAGTMQRSGGYFQKAAEIVASGALGEITFCHTFQADSTKKEGYGAPPDSDPPPGLDWDMWLGPARKVPFNANRWGVNTAHFPTFRYFWDYAGGAMTDWGVHLIDPLHQCFGEVMPKAISAQGSKFYVADNRDTPDTMLATFQYPKFLASYESRICNPAPLINNQKAGTAIHGTEGTLMLTRGGCWVMPKDQSDLQAVAYEKDDSMSKMNQPHWMNFLACVKSRQKPVSDIETCVRSSTVCILGNLAMRYRTMLDWDETHWTVRQKEIRPFLQPHYRAPWKLEV